MKSRNQILESASVREFDLLVIGGGIVGAGVTQDAASRGLSVLLVERDDFASGTSSRTTKLIHGGLRYLEQLKVNLTKELCHERALLEQLAPHLVRDFSFILPIAKDEKFFGLKAKVGLTLYDFLAGGNSGNHRHESLNQKELLEAAPALSSDLVNSGLRFHDCITDDSRLVLEVIKSACSDGAMAVNYMEVLDFITEDGVITGAKCKDRYAGNEISIRCKMIVNAAGVWTDDLLLKANPQWKSRVVPAKGVHIMVPPSAFETNNALFLPTGDGRYVFVVPWQRALMIGTTDTSFKGDLNQPLPNRDEVQYLINCVNRYTSGRKLTLKDVIAAWAGVRPLINEPVPAPKVDMHPKEAAKLAQAESSDAGTGTTANLSREHQIIEGPGGIIAMIGGKLTNYRLMATQALDKLTARHPEIAASKNQSRTRRMMIGGWADKNDFLTQTAAIAAKARKFSIEPATLDHLISSYGKDAQMIVDLVEQDPSLNERVCPDFPPIMAEIPFCVANEMAVSLEDLLFRRMRLGMLHQIQCRAAGPKVASLMQSLLNWDSSRAALELQALERTLDAHMASFRDVAAPVL
jgi:glycerol-3-phosphate dehydrogenase